MRNRTSPTLVAVGLAISGMAPLHADAARAAGWAVEGLVGKEGKEAEDVSGIACAPEAEGARLCLLIDDEVQFAQWVTLKGRGIVPGELLPLIAGFFDEEPVELDGEGAAFADGAFYVTGSFGQPRSGAPDEEGAARLKADTHLFRIVLDSASSGNSFRISDSRRLRSVALEDVDLRPFADKELKENGLTVEAIAVLGDTAYIGFRGPVLGDAKDRAAILPLPLATLFDGAPLPADTAVRKLPLGKGQGIRDLAPVGDELLVLAGPVGDRDEDHLAEGAYRLFRWNPQSNDPIEVFTIEAATHGDNKPDKPEAIQPLAKSEGKLEVLVLSDGPDLGAPKSYQIDWAE